MATADTPMIVIEDQGPRDGFQSERAVVPTALKLEWIAGLVDAGIRRVQVASFVHPKLVPQMADAEAVCAGLSRQDSVVFSGLVLNERGIERAIEAGLKHVAISHSASDTHSRKNTRLSLDEAQAAVALMIDRARQAGLAVRGGVQCAFGCRSEGRIEPGDVIAMAENLLTAGVDELALADSTGMADPRSIRELMRTVVPMAEGRPVFLHLHDTEGRGMANALAAIDEGVRHFDTALAGMGGCPYIKGASGNISTEDLVCMAHQMGFETGIDPRKVAAVSARVETFFERTFPGKMHRVLANHHLATLV
jgi:hydroxymethylglutaryl-CoA lyase